MKSVRLKLFSEPFHEAKIAIRLFQLFQGQFLNPNSINQEKYFRSKLTKFKNDGSILSFLEEYNETSLIDVVQATGIALNFWVYPSEQCDDLIIPRLVRTFSCHSPFFGTLNLWVNRESTEINIESKLRLILDETFIRKINENCISFSQNISKFTGFPVSYIDQLWPLPFSIMTERKFAKIFGFGFEFWEAETRYCKKTDKLVTASKRLYKSSQQKFVTLQAVTTGWNDEKHLITSADLFVLRNSEDFKFFMCPKPWCFFNSDQIGEMNRHKCKNKTTVTFCQRNLLSETAKEYMIRKGIISEFSNFNFVAFDIETFGRPEDTHLSEKTLVKSSHRLVSISVTPNFGNFGSQVFMRDDWSEESLDKTVKDFWNFILKMKVEHIKSIPQDIINALDYVEHQLNGDLTVNKRAQLRRCKRYLKSLFHLKVIGFNNERFDNVVLFPTLLKIWDPKNSNSKTNPLDVIRRGNGLMTIRYDGVIINDSHNFYVSGSLDSFGRRFGAPINKLIWPYEHFKSISELDTTDWPKFRTFQNTLRQHNNISNVIDSMRTAYDYAYNNLKVSPKQFFEQFDINDAFEPFEVNTFPADLRLKENVGHFFPIDPLTYCEVWHHYVTCLNSGEYFSLKDYLRKYNEVDTVVTATAFTNMSKLFHQKFQVNLLDYPSLPSAALQILWNFYDSNCDAPYTFCQNFDWVANSFRDQLQGGYSGVMHTHVEIGASEFTYGDAVYFAPDGQVFVEFRYDDFSNLYGFAKQQKLPAGMGHLFTKNEDGTFDTELMLPTEIEDRCKFKAKFSKEAIEWLSYQQSLPQFQDYKIEMYVNGGEKLCILEGLEFSPDGYVQINGHSYYFQYYGCAYHDHNCSISRKSPFLRDDTEERNRKINKLCQRYGTLITIYSCDWYKLRRSVTYRHVISKFFNQKKVKEQTIINAIISGDIYGFVCCDIHSPQNVIDFYMKLNWPPIMAKITPDETMISPFILERMKANGQKIETEQLTQCFHAKNHLISTDFFQFYHSVGMKLSNIKYVIEYSPCKPLKKFVDEVTECRKQAVLANQKELQEIYKVSIKRLNRSFIAHCLKTSLFS